MIPTHGRRALAFVVVLALVAACSPSPAPAGPPAAAATTAAPQPVRREAVLAEPETVAAMLADPSRRIDGIWSMLTGLGIGVYTPDGRQVLQGSETSDDDFFLYDFEVPLLASMAGWPAQPFSDLYAVFARAGYRGSPAELAMAFTSAFGEQAEGFLPRLLAGLGASGDQPDLTPLESWLLLLSAAPLNRGSAPARTALTLGRPAARCNGIVTGAGVQPNWVSGDQPWLDELEFQQAEMIYYAIHGPILAHAVTGTFDAEPSSVHESHTGPGATSQLTVRLDVLFIPQSVDLGNCGRLVNLIRPVVGPVPAVPVEWHIDTDLAAHGTLAVPEGGSKTDDRGLATVTFTAQTEASGGQGSERSMTGAVVALLPAKDVFQAYLGITDPRLLIFVPYEIPVQGTLAVAWHELEPTPEPQPSCSAGLSAGDYAGTLVYTTTTPYLTHTGTGSIHFTVGADGQVVGAWDLAYVSTSGTGEMGTGQVSDGVVSGTPHELLLAGTNSVATSHGTGTTLPWPDTPLTVQPVCDDGPVAAEFQAGALTVSVSASRR